jgi:drug/metabolite transporter (DMT)-like permease
VTPKQLGLYVSIASIWGCTWFFILKVVQAFGGGGVALRSIIGSLALVVFALASRKRLKFGALAPLLVVGATTVAGQLMGFNLATPMVGTAVTAILAATIPMFSMVLGRMWKVEHITALGYVGLALGFGGVALIVGFPTVEITMTFIIGCVICILGAISAAYGSLYTRKHLQGIGYWEQTIGSFFLGGLMMLPLFLIDPPTRTPEAIDYFYLAVLSVVSTGLAYIMYFKLVGEIGATKALTTEFLVTGIAVTVGAVFLGERLSQVQVVGVFVILLGCSLVLNLLPLRRTKSGVAVN